MIFHGIVPRKAAWDIARNANAERPMPQESKERYLSGDWDVIPDVQLLATGAELAFQLIDEVVRDAIDEIEVGAQFTARDILQDRLGIGGTEADRE